MCDNTPDRLLTVISDRPEFTLTNLHPHSKYRIGVAARTTIPGAVPEFEIYSRIFLTNL